MIAISGGVVKHIRRKRKRKEERRGWNLGVRSAGPCGVEERGAISLRFLGKYCWFVLLVYWVGGDSWRGSYRRGMNIVGIVLWGDRGGGVREYRRGNGINPLLVVNILRSISSYNQLASAYNG